MVSIDLYVNETTRHADVDPAAALAPRRRPRRPAVRAVCGAERRALVAAGGRARRGRALPTGRSCSPLAERLGGGPSGQPLDWMEPSALARSASASRWNPDDHRGARARTGRHGDGFLPVVESGLSRAKLAAAPHGIDLGPLETGIAAPRLPRGRQDAPRADGPLSRRSPTSRRRSRIRPRRTSSCSIGRRELRTNNSWMHNAPRSCRARALRPDRPSRRRPPRRGRSTASSRVLESRVHRGTPSVHVSDEMSSRRREPAARLGPRRERALATGRREPPGRVRQRLDRRPARSRRSSANRS